MITERHGNLLDDPAEALVNPVNTAGVMGAGLAKQFKTAHPEMFAAYAEACAANMVAPGHMYLWFAPTRPRILGETRLRMIINFPTKRHWKDRSRVVDIVDGLLDLKRVVADHSIGTLATPLLGCGHGGLSATIVRPLIRIAFGHEPDLHTTLYLGVKAP